MLLGSVLLLFRPKDRMIFSGGWGCNFAPGKFSTCTFLFVVDVILERFKSSILAEIFVSVGGSFQLFADD